MRTTFGLIPAVVWVWVLIFVYAVGFFATWHWLLNQDKVNGQHIGGKPGPITWFLMALFAVEWPAVLFIEFVWPGQIKRSRRG